MYQIVPTSYKGLNSNEEINVYQYTASFNQVQSQMLPAIYFRFDLSPITVKYWQYKDDFSHFVVQICAIVGGVFAVTGILDALLYKYASCLARLINGDKDNEVMKD